jgi:Rrf2 family nitric oxide-sensitive transcriptional repressor
MISQTAEYALRAIVFIADHPDQAHTADAIAQGTKVPVGYLAKIMQILTKAGLVTSQRGLYGGFTLKREPRELTVYDVVQCIDPIHRIHSCPLELEDHGSGLCPLHRTLDNALAVIETQFKKMTVHQLLNQPQNTLHPLCSFPRKVSGAKSAAKASPKPAAT